MSKDARTETGLIGPNAILQLLPVLDRCKGRDGRTQLLARAGVFQIPDGSHMIPETVVARVHRQLRLEEPELSKALACHAGLATANYILAHRIPQPAQRVLKLLPPWAAARALSQAIARHAWTFVGSGRFAVVDPWTFEIEDNPLIRGECCDTCLCHWHAGVFTRLFQTLVAKDCFCVETRCGAQANGGTCRFELARHPSPVPATVPTIG